MENSERMRSTELRQPNINFFTAFKKTKVAKT
jgi:hypothetical protein